ncbi:MAG TPA: aminotransferase class I/II-fold pyridoxal phosphate-dependent enzyme [Pyrinomonadaceae bacterium]|nr:aminotransferase class I/II-fold pyridoxal phosphate-dependent enzyme [Pyrinomonadaceae bacterium]
MKQTDSDTEGFAPPAGDMSAEEFRRHGHALIDWISDYFSGIEARPVLAQVKPRELIEKLPAAPPATGETMDAILADVDRLITPALTHWSHPSFFAYFATSTSAPGIFGELLSAAFDVKALLWRTSPAAAELEEVALSWLRQMLGLPAEFAGIIYDTASVSSLHAIAAARENVNLDIREQGLSGRDDLPLLRVYASEQSHSSIDKAVIALGLGQRSLRKIPADAEFRMDAEALARAIEEDLRAGFRPFCVVATVGTTSTTSIDPVAAIADICEQHGLWLHVDAAYAGSAGIVPELRPLVMDGCQRADSLTLNPHKWLFTPFDLSVLYCRRIEVLHRAFSLVPEYLRTPESETEGVRNGADYGVQLGRRFRSLKFWMILRYFGHSGLAARIREHCRLARLFASWVEQSTDWELLAPVPLSVVCFRARPSKENETDAERNTRLDALNERLMHAANATGSIFISHTRLNNKFTLRLAVGNIRTTEEHVQRAWQLLNETLQTSLNETLRTTP